jgi:YebC/PmpR family DNA-binding regulatory protein
MFEATFEGYGPGGSAVMVDVVSDNRNRAVQEIRSTFSRAGGNLGESGGVAWMFENRGVISIPAEGIDIDEISLKAIDAGAQDIYPQTEYIEIYTAATELEAVRKTLEESGVEIESAELSKIPTTTITLDEQTSFQVLRLLEKLEELDDVQNVYSNVDFTDELIENFRAQSR